MKLSISVSDKTASLLEQAVGEIDGATASLIADLAVGQFLALPPGEIARLVGRHKLNRKASTRSGWAEAFWSMLGLEMRCPDTIDNPFTARNFGPLYVVLLMNHVAQPDAEGDPFPIFIGPRMWTPEAPSPYQWAFERSMSPVAAAEIVALKLGELLKVQSS
jgi:hypothetical protein